MTRRTAAMAMAAEAEQDLMDVLAGLGFDVNARHRATGATTWSLGPMVMR